MKSVHTLRSLGRVLSRFFSDRRGSADLNTYLLLTAAGCVMVGITAPSMFKSSKTASDTFENQVQILQRGSSGGTGGGGGGGGGGFDLGGITNLVGTIGNAASQIGNAANQIRGGGGSGGSGGGLVSGGGDLTNGGGSLVTGGGPTVTAETPLTAAEAARRAAILRDTATR